MLKATMVLSQRLILVWQTVLVAAFCFLGSAGTLAAQDALPGFDPGLLGLPEVPGAATDDPATLSAEYTLDASGKSGKVSVTATLADGFHLYSTTQAPGGPLKTTIKLQSPGIKLTGAFEPNAPPHITQNAAWPGLKVEEHEGAVTWTAPFESETELNPERMELVLNFDGLACTTAGACIPVEKKLVARAGITEMRSAPPAGAPKASISSGAGTNTVSPKPSIAKPSGGKGSLSVPSLNIPAPSGAGGQAFPIEDTHAALTAWIEPARVAPGGEATVFLQFDIDEGYHLYQFIADDKDTKFRTLIVPTEKSGLELALPQTDSPIHPDELDPTVMEHSGTATWRVPVRVPANLPAGEYKLEFALGVQTCTTGTCDPPSGATVTGVLQVGGDEAKSAARADMIVANNKFKLAASQPKLGTWGDFEASSRGSAGASPSTGQVAASGANSSAQTKTNATSAAEPEKASLTITSLLLALLGGVILNFMPCVLPVIGLKIMGFVEQSGSDRGEIIKLNIAYVLGILAVMWVLAGVTVMLGNAFGWGEQFTYLEFKVFLAALVLAMALSFLGVWEIPIPGFATSYKSNKLMEREGVIGAFSKGLLTTILATPCSGPFLGVVFGLTLTLSPVGIFTVYTAVGLGMGLPFLLLCIWPDAVRVLPKPGAWMETLKEVLAFPLLLTVVYMVAAISSDYRVATLSLLIAVWFACWIIGKVPAYEAFQSKAKAWLIGAAVIAAWGFASFSLFGPINSKLPWQPFTPEGLAALRSSGKTVMVDFTANWCLNCQVNTRVAIERPGVAEVVKKNDVAPMLADWTDKSDEIREQLAKLNSKQIPLLAIFPADPKAEPIVLRDLITEQMLIEALEKAGPSRKTGKTVSTPAPVPVH